MKPKTRKTLSIILSIAMVLTLFPVGSLMSSAVTDEVLLENFGTTTPGGIQTTGAGFVFNDDNGKALELEGTKDNFTANITDSFHKYVTIDPTVDAEKGKATLSQHLGEDLKVKADESLVTGTQAKAFLVEGENTFTITTTTSGKQETFKATINNGYSGGKLGNIQVSEGTLDRKFDSEDTEDYNVTVKNTVESIDITPTFSDGTVKFSCGDITDKEVKNGEAFTVDKLPFGITTVSVAYTKAGSSEPTNYTINITKEAAENQFSALKLSSDELTGKTDKSIALTPETWTWKSDEDNAYKATISADDQTNKDIFTAVTSVDFTPTFANGTLTINGKEAENNKAFPVDVACGENVVELAFTPSGTNAKAIEGTVTISVEGEDGELNNIKASLDKEGKEPLELEPAYSADVTEYTIQVPENEVNAYVLPVFNSGATVTINEKEYKSSEAIMVKLPDDPTNVEVLFTYGKLSETYTLTFVKSEEPVEEVGISALTISAGEEAITLEPDFDPAGGVFAGEVPADATEVTIEGEYTGEGEVTITGVEGAEITAEDGALAGTVPFDAEEEELNFTVTFTPATAELEDDEEAPADGEDVAAAEAIEYEFTLTREGAEEGGITAIALDGASFDEEPEFTEDEATFNAVLDEDNETGEVSVTVTFEGGEVTIDGETATSDEPFDLGEITEETEVVIEFTPEGEEEATQIYTIVIATEPVEEIGITDITTLGITVDGAFDFTEDDLVVTATLDEDNEDGTVELGIEYVGGDILVTANDEPLIETEDSEEGLDFYEFTVEEDTEVFIEFYPEGEEEATQTVTILISTEPAVEEGIIAIVPDGITFEEELDLTEDDVIIAATLDEDNLDGTVELDVAYAGGDIVATFNDEILEPDEDSEEGIDCFEFIVEEDSEVYIEFTPEDGEEVTQTVTILISTEPLGEEEYIADIALEGATLEPEFDAETEEYDAVVDEDAEAITMTVSLAEDVEEGTLEYAIDLEDAVEIEDGEEVDLTGLVEEGSIVTVSYTVDEEVVAAYIINFTAGDVDPQMPDVLVDVEDGVATAIVEDVSDEINSEMDYMIIDAVTGEEDVDTAVVTFPEEVLEALKDVLPALSEDFFITVSTDAGTVTIPYDALEEFLNSDGIITVTNDPALADNEDIEDAIPEGAIVLSIDLGANAEGQIDPPIEISISDVPFENPVAYWYHDGMFRRLGGKAFFGNGPLPLFFSFFVTHCSDFVIMDESMIPEIKDSLDQSMNIEELDSADERYQNGADNWLASGYEYYAGNEFKKLVQTDDLSDEGGKTIYNIGNVSSDEDVVIAPEGMKVTYYEFDGKVFDGIFVNENNIVAKESAGGEE